MAGIAKHEAKAKGDFRIKTKEYRAKSEFV